jgi:DNA end-binding protein Ku
MAARSVWTGTITVGLLTIPVKLYTAVRHKSISFNQLDETTHSRIRYQKVAEATEEVVPTERIVKGYDLGGDNWVIITDDDLAPLSPAKTKEIGVETFVSAGEIPAVMYDAGYLVGPGKAAAKPYALLVRALAETGRVGIGKFVMRQKEHLCAIRSDGHRLTLSTMVFPDEVVDPADEDDLEPVRGDVNLTDRELAMAHTLVEALSEPFEPENYVDTYRQSVMELIEAKAEGRALPVEAGPTRGEVIDLASALEASVEAAKASRRRHPTARQPAEKAAAKPSRRKSA